MSHPVTEIAYTVLKPGLKFEDSESAAQVMDDTLKGVREQEGCIRCYYGQAMQDEDLLIFFVEWASHQSHTNFMSSAFYGPFMDNFNTILMSEDTTHVNHISPDPFPATILNRAPCLEFLTFYDIEPDFAADIKTFCAALENAKPEGLVDVLSCMVLEDNVTTHAEMLKGKKEGEGVGKALVLFTGWSNMEAYSRYTETAGFKQNSHLLSDKCREVERVSLSSHLHKVDLSHPTPLKEILTSFIPLVPFLTEVFLNADSKNTNHISID